MKSDENKNSLPKDNKSYSTPIDEKVLIDLN